MAITTKEELEKLITLTEYERNWFKISGDKGMPFLVPDILSEALENDGVRKQFVPSIEEIADSVLTLDPQEESKYSPLPRLVHRYPNRVAFKVSDRCFGYCRYCFRRRMIEKEHLITSEEIDAVAEYLEHDYLYNDGLIEEILITGGDPLTLSNEILEKILTKIREANPEIIIRLCTRALCTMPKRFDEDLLLLLEAANVETPLFLITQFNTADEIMADAFFKAKELNKRGIAMFNQSVLLKGVNDDAEKLKELSRSLLTMYIKPYYIFLCDDVAGTEHFFVPKERALEIENALRKISSGLEMPTFMKDLPNGGGKVPLHQLF